jgi:hypothetical protein
MPQNMITALRASKQLMPEHLLNHKHAATAA